MGTLVVRLVVLGLLLASCSTGGAVAEDTDVAALEQAAGNVAAFCNGDRVRDRDRLRDLSGDQLRLREQDMDRLHGGCAGLSIEGFDTTIDGDEASVRIRYRARGAWGDGECDLAFERASGQWRLLELPECPRTDG